MSLLIEAGKLAEHLRWHGDEALRARIAEDPEQVSDELADVLYWMLLLAHDLGTDLDAAIAGRTLKVERKDPLASARGSAWKYEERLHGMDLRGGVVAVPAEVGVLPADAPVVARVHVGGFGDGQLERLAGCAVPGGAAFEAHQALAVDAVLDVDLRADLHRRPSSAGGGRPPRWAAPPRSEPTDEPVAAFPAARQSGETGLWRCRSETFEPLEVICRDDRRDDAAAAGDEDGDAVFGAADERRESIARLGDGDLLSHAALHVAGGAVWVMVMASARAVEAAVPSTAAVRSTAAAPLTGAVR